MNNYDARNHKARSRPPNYHERRLNQKPPRNSSTDFHRVLDKASMMISSTQTALEKYADYKENMSNTESTKHINTLQNGKPFTKTQCISQTQPDSQSRSRHQKSINLSTERHFSKNSSHSRTLSQQLRTFLPTSNHHSTEDQNYIMEK